MKTPIDYLLQVDKSFAVTRKQFTLGMTANDILDDDRTRVYWQLFNPTTTDIFFSIGATAAPNAGLRVLWPSFPMYELTIEEHKNLVQKRVSAVLSVGSLTGVLLVVNYLGGY